MMRVKEEEKEKEERKVNCQIDLFVSLLRSVYRESVNHIQMLIRLLR